MDRVLTEQFWKGQWAVVASAPWVVIPLLLLASFVGWKGKGINDDGEMRGLRAERDAAVQRLELANEKIEDADEKYEAVVSRVDELGDKVGLQEVMLAELKKTGIPQTRFVGLLTSNTEIQNVVTSLSTSINNLGVVLTDIEGLWKPNK
jgi:hypothetical protein